MDLNDYWQEHKRFVMTVASGGLLFVVGWLAVGSIFRDGIDKKKREIAQRRADLGKPVFDSQDLADAREENERLQEAVERLISMTEFQALEAFRLDPADPAGGSASNQYLRALSRVREELIPRAKRANLEIDSALGMPALSPTRDDEIIRYLEALDLVSSVVDLAIASQVRRVERIQIHLDPGLNSREGVGAIERTRISFTLSGRSQALERMLARTQRPGGGRILHVDSAEMVPSRGREDEVRLEITFALARLASPPEEVQPAEES